MPSMSNLRASQMAYSQIKVWCPNCLRGMYIPQSHSGEFRKVKCEYCPAQFMADRYGQVKRIKKDET